MALPLQGFNIPLPHRLPLNSSTGSNSLYPGSRTGRRHAFLLPPPPLPLPSATAQVTPFPSDDDPPEASEDSSHGVSRIQQFERQVSRARKKQEEQFEKDKPIFLSALALEHDAPDSPVLNNSTDTDDLSGDIDQAIAFKRKEFVEQGLLPPNPRKQNEPPMMEGIDELSPEEVLDLEEIKALQGLSVVSREEGLEVDEDNGVPLSSSPFDLDFDSMGKSTDRILEPVFKMTLAELMDESKVVPISVFGDLDVVISGIQKDSREVTAGCLFVCCVENGVEGWLASLTEADKRGAVAVVADREINLDETLGCKALVVVEDAKEVLPILAASFYKHPSKSMAVIGIVGSSGKTTTTHLVKAMYETMGLRTGMLGALGCYVHGKNKVDSLNKAQDAVTVQRLMAKMVHNGTEAMVMDASYGLETGMRDEVDFDVAVFINFNSDQFDVHEMERYRKSESEVFAKMLDPERHRKIVNIDDPNAPYFIAQGNSDVPIVTFSMENKNADVHPLKYELSLFEIEVLVKTPLGLLEISSGLLGRNNIYNILAVVAVGIAVGAPLEGIVRGIEEVDSVPGRCELIDEEQAFAVVVDGAHTPETLSQLLDTCRELRPNRIITVFGCCGEGDRGKRPLMTKIATDKSDVVMLTSDNPGNEDPLDILDDMLAGVGWSMEEYLRYGENDYYPPLKNGHRLFLHDIRRVAVRAAVAMGEEGDIVVIAGKGHEAYQIEGDKKEFFDDREECREALHYVDELHQAGIDTSEFPWRLPESH